MSLSSPNRNWQRLYETPASSVSGSRIWLCRQALREAFPMQWSAASIRLSGMQGSHRGFSSALSYGMGITALPPKKREHLCRGSAILFGIQRADFRQRPGNLPRPRRGMESVLEQAHEHRLRPVRQAGDPAHLPRRLSSPARSLKRFWRASKRKFSPPSLHGCTPLSSRKRQISAISRQRSEYLRSRFPGVPTESDGLTARLAWYAFRAFPPADLLVDLHESQKTLTIGPAEGSFVRILPRPRLAHAS